MKIRNFAVTLINLQATLRSKRLELKRQAGCSLQSWLLLSVDQLLLAFRLLQKGERRWAPCNTFSMSNTDLDTRYQLALT